MMKQSIKTGILLLACSTFSAIGAVGLYDYYHNRTVEGAVVEEGGAFKQSNLRPVSYFSDSTPQDFVDVAERSINGVVNIRAEVSLPKSQRRQSIDPFEYFFGPFGSGESYGNRQPQTRVGIGSGVIISTDGYIITNNHVIDKATKITVTSNDNREWEAKVIGADPATDIALLKIEATELVALPMGDSEALRVGEWVLAIGNPFNLSSTVTAGIVSAKGRSTMAAGELQIASFIQTDAAVNPGNSGGALVNTRGELIGINTMIYSQTGNYAGYSFAVPVSIASKVVADLKQYGAVQRAVLGVVGGNIDAEVTKKYDLKVTEGAVIVEFSDHSSARAAGMKEGDVITQVNGSKVRSMAELQEQMSKYRPGEKVKVEVNRSGKSHTLTVELKNRRGTTDVVSNTTTESLGAAFKPLSDKQKSRLGIDYGVEVAGVDAGKLKEAGVSKGFIILSINSFKVSTADEVEQIVTEVLESSSDKVLFIKGIHPSGKVRYVAVDLN